MYSVAFPLSLTLCRDNRLHKDVTEKLKEVFIHSSFVAATTITALEQRRDQDEMHWKLSYLRMITFERVTHNAETMHFVFRCSSFLIIVENKHDFTVDPKLSDHWGEVVIGTSFSGRVTHLDIQCGIIWWFQWQSCDLWARPNALLEHIVICTIEIIFTLKWRLKWRQCV